MCIVYCFRRVNVICFDKQFLVANDEMRKFLDSQELSFLWQVCYEQGGVQFWWDYEETISFGLENAFKNGELFGFEWDWKERKDGEISEYLAS